MRSKAYMLAIIELQCLSKIKLDNSNSTPLTAHMMVDSSPFDKPSQHLVYMVEAKLILEDTAIQKAIVDEQTMFFIRKRSHCWREAEHRADTYACCS